MQKITYYRIRFMTVGAQTSRLLFNLEKADDPTWKHFSCIVYHDTQAECERVLKGILEGEKEVIVIQPTYETITGRATAIHNHSRV